MTRRFVKMIYTIKNVITFDLGNCHEKKSEGGENDGCPKG